MWLLLLNPNCRYCRSLKQSLTRLTGQPWSEVERALVDVGVQAVDVTRPGNPAEGLSYRGVPALVLSRDQIVTGSDKVLSILADRLDQAGMGGAGVGPFSQW